MHSHLKKFTVAAAALAILGVLVSAYATYQHYRPSGTSFCNLNNVVSCDIVNKSKYSEIAGVPVSIIGIIGYLVLAGIAASLFAGRIKKQHGALALIFLSGGALFFSFYLTFIEFFWLNALCPICITSQIIIFLIFIISLILWRISSKLPA
ncbi:vitamin K epoxide reductase family protein [Candidatus Peregrinibacteria bacterium]|nr:vitamin K epoxide reductase family protein [Candidatus Peregrinibacteria bacterium]